MLIIISAPSGAGKTTLCDRLLKEFPDQVELSISSTTRKPRKGESHGVHYFFTDADDFQKQIANDRFAEWALVHGNYYGTSKDKIEAIMSRGKSVVLDIDVQGAYALRKAYPGQCLLIFISPPNLNELEKRLRGRGTDDEAVIQKRIQNAIREMDHSQDFDHIIVNDRLDQAYADLKKIVSDKIFSANRARSRSS